VIPPAARQGFGPKRFEKLGAMIGNDLAQSANAIIGVELP